MTFLTKQRVKILTVKDLKYLQSYYVLHKSSYTKPLFMPICYGKEENRTKAMHTFLKVTNSITDIIRFHFGLL